ncbi:MAG: DUF2089 domain-containing protein [Kyrpidia sp.]|nr:DUF2089 domain-containing protein [Kyrpidia sp.]
MKGWLSRCPACAGPLAIAEFVCEECGTMVRGRFTPAPWMRLQPDQWEFVLRFLKARGNLREMERELGISYPTVRSRLEQILRAMGLEEGTEDVWEPERPAEILRAVETGELSVDEAVRELEQLSKRRETHA